jgi:hypothetical protein
VGGSVAQMCCRASAREPEPLEQGPWEDVTTMDDNEHMRRRSDSARSAPGASRRIGLVGCVKAKASGPRAAKDLYVSALFSGRRAFVRRTCGEWWILSAEHGLVHPDEVIASYDKTLKDAGRAARREWSTRVLRAIDERVRPAAGDVFEIHAGAEYRDFGLVDGLRSRGCVVENPTEGLGIGQQLRFYKQAERRQP